MLDYSGGNFQGHNFRGKDLSGCDFSNADIRGADFTDAILREAKFRNARAGMQAHRLLVHIIGVLLFSIISHYILTLIFFSIQLSLQNNPVREVVVILKACLVGVISVVFFSFIRYGFSLNSLGFIAFFGPVVGFLTLVGAYCLDKNMLDITSVVLPIVLIGSIGLAMAILASGAIAVVMAGRYALKVYPIGVVMGTAVCFVANRSLSISYTVALGVIANLALSGYAASRVLARDDRYELIRDLVVGVGAIGGTSFSGADLSGAEFTGSLLKNTNFSHSKQKATNLQHVVWHSCTGLEKAYFGNSPMANPILRELLLTGNGGGQSYVGLDLKGVNLQSSNLEDADLKYSDLTDALFTNANLKNINLTGAIALGSDFSNSCMTGACLESLNFNSATQFHNVDCQYVYMLEKANKLGDRERRPHDPTNTFAPGDFENLYQEVPNAIELLIKNGIDRKAFQESFNKVCGQNIGVSKDSIQSIEKRGDDILVTLQVPESTDKSQVESRFHEEYRLQILQLQSEVNQLHQLRSSDMKEILLNLTQRDITINNQALGNGEIMNTDSSQSIQVSGNFNINARNSVISLREVSGSVDNSIQQLSSSSSESVEIINALNDLKQVIEKSIDLSEDDKLEALQQVDTIAQAAQNINKTDSKKMVNTAMKILKGTASMLPAAASLAESLTKCIPIISAFFGM
jgi:uncharacterized protein YjbI with pentapeptide repeats